MRGICLAMPKDRRQEEQIVAAERKGVRRRLVMHGVETGDPVAINVMHTLVALDSLYRDGEREWVNPLA